MRPSEVTALALPCSKLPHPPAPVTLVSSWGHRGAHPRSTPATTGHPYSICRVWCCLGSGGTILLSVPKPLLLQRGCLGVVLGAKMHCPMQGYPLAAPSLRLVCRCVWGGWLLLELWMEIICPFILVFPCQMTASLSMGRWSLCSPTAPRRSKVWLAQCHGGLEVDAVSSPSPQLYTLVPPL